MEVGVSKNNDNLFYLLCKVAEDLPGSPFFVYEGKVVTYSSGLLKIKKLAHFLRRHGINRGDRVILYLGNTPEFIISYLAIAQLGAISVLVNPMAKRYELDFCIKKVKPKLIITYTELVENLQIENEYIIGSEQIIKFDTTEKNSTFYSLIETENTLENYETNISKEPLSIIFSSASHGIPLGSQLTHEGILEISYGISKHSIASDIFITVLPLFHAFGLTSSFITPIICKLPFFLVNEFSPKKMIQLLSQEKISIFIGIPGMFKILNRLIKRKSQFPNMRLLISGGEAISSELQIKYKERFGVDLTQGYGLTEASSIVTWNHTRIHNKIGSVGRPMPWNNIKIMNDGTEVPHNQQGEIVVRGKNVINGYYLANFSLTDGYLHTGDLGHIDDEGYLFITGRIKEMTINSGLNVYQMEVEKILEKHPLVKEVKVTRKLAPKDDSTFHEFHSATIYSRNGACINSTSFLHWCKKNISAYKIPRQIFIK